MPPAPTPPTPSRTTAPVLQPPRWEDTPCQFKVPAGQTEGKTVTCGYVVVPESRSQPTGATIRLAVAVFKDTAANPDPAPLVWLDGGPGGPSLDQIGAAMIPALGRFLAGDRDLICGNASFEEIRKLLHVLQVHERERIFRTINFRQSEHDKALVGDELEILPHVCDRQARNSAAKDVLRELHFAFDSFVQHFDDLAVEMFVKKVGLLVANLFYYVECECHVG